MQRISIILATALLGSSLAACSTMPGPYNGLGSDAMSMVVVHKNPDYGPMTDRDYQTTSGHVNSCLHDVRQQQAGLAETMGSTAVVTGAGAAAGEAFGYHSEVKILGARMIPHALPAVTAATGILGAAEGAASGAMIKSQAVTSIVGSCANGDLHDARTAKNIQGVHVYGSFVRTNNRTGQLPPWVVRVGSANLDVSRDPNPDTSDPQSH